MITQCHAEDPTVCRVHSPVDAFSIITQPALAESNLEHSLMLLDEAKTSEEISEATLLVQKDKDLYNSTVPGLRKLSDKFWEDLSPTEEFTYKKLYADALKQRKAILIASPAWAKPYAQYEYIVNTYGVESFVRGETGEFGEKAIAGIGKIQFGTPIVLLAVSGAIIYDKAGDGSPDSAERDYPRGDFATRGEYGGISLKNNLIMTHLSDIQELHVLNQDVTGKIKPVVPTVNYRVDIVPDNEHGIWIIKGSGFHYQLDGAKTSGSIGTRPALDAESWQRRPLGGFQQRWSESQGSYLNLEPCNVIEVNKITV